MEELEATINATDCDLVLIGTPVDLGRLLKINKPAVRVRYELDEDTTALLTAEIEQALVGIETRSATEGGGAIQTTKSPSHEVTK